MDHTDVVGLVSGGKDSVFNLFKCLQAGHTIRCLANLHPAERSSEELDSHCFQTVGYNVLPAIAECMGLPLIRRATAGRAIQQHVAYRAPDTVQSSGDDADEIDELFLLLLEVRVRFPTVRAVSCGAILSSYQRLRVEAVAAKLGMTVFAFLWQREQLDLLDEMIDAGIHAVLIKVAACGLSKRLLGTSLLDARPALLAAADSFGVSVCGEGGEFESLVLDFPPLFTHGCIVLDSTTAVSSGGEDGWGAAAHLRIERHHVEPRGALVAVAAAVGGDNEEATRIIPSACAPPLVDSASPVTVVITPLVAVTAASPDLGPDPPVRVEVEVLGCAPAPATEACTPAASEPAACIAVPTFGARVSRRSLAAGGSSGRDSLAEEVSRATDAVLSALHAWLLRNLEGGSGGGGLADCLFLRLHTADMAGFEAINAAYSVAFARLCPWGVCAARSCVQTRLPDGFLLAVDGFACLGSAARVAEVHGGGHRSLLHVRSISEWAPVCIGPYCQANSITLAASAAASEPESPPAVLHLIAGQIGLDPASMRLVSAAPFAAQLHRAQQNAAAVVLAITRQSQAAAATAVGQPPPAGGAAVACTVYVSEAALAEHGGYAAVRAEVLQATRARRGWHLAGLLQVAALPRGATVEVEVVAASHSVVSSRLLCAAPADAAGEAAVTEVAAAVFGQVTTFSFGESASAPRAGAGRPSGSSSSGDSGGRSSPCLAYLELHSDTQEALDAALANEGAFLRGFDQVRAMAARQAAPLAAPPFGGLSVACSSLGCLHEIARPPVDVTGLVCMSSAPEPSVAAAAAAASAAGFNDQASGVPRTGAPRYSLFLTLLRGVRGHA